MSGLFMNLTTGVEAHGDPLTGIGRFLDGFQNSLIFHPVLEGGLNGVPIDHGVHEIRQRVNERVLVSNDMSRWPPLSDERMTPPGLRHQDVSEALAIVWLGVVEILESIHVLEIEAE